MYFIYASASVGPVLFYRRVVMETTVVVCLFFLHTIPGIWMADRAKFYFELLLRWTTPLPG